MKMFILILIVGVSLTSNGQDEDWRLFKSSDDAHDSLVATKPVVLDTIKMLKTAPEGNVTITKDERITTVTDLKRGQVSMNKPGYRIQIKMSNQKEVVTGARAQFLRGNTNHKAHLEYEQPNFVLKVGDFYTKQQALEFMLEIKEFFPESLLIKDNIELPKLPENL